MHVDLDVIAVLQRARCDGRSLVLTGQLDRRLYERVNKVLEAAGGKWSRKAKAHLFDLEADEAIEPVLLTGSVVDAKRQWDLFDTPPELAAELVREADVRPGMKALEPSAGLGRIAQALARAGAKVTCVEVLPVRARHLRSLGFDVLEADFLKVDLPATYDRVVMNPPFRGQADLAHVRRAHSLLREGGRLVAVMAGGLTFRQNRATVDFREWLSARGGTWRANVGMAFASSGTSVQTLTVVIPA